MSRDPGGVGGETEGTSYGELNIPVGIRVTGSAQPEMGQLEVVAPGGYLAVEQLERAHHRQRETGLGAGPVFEELGPLGAERRVS